MLPTFETYGNYSSQNYNAHALVFTDPAGNDYYFSYKTLIAYRPAGARVIVRQNDWGPTTGKHLNAIDGGDKKARIPGEEFERLFREFSNKAA